MNSGAIALLKELHVDGPALLKRQGLSTEWLTLVADWHLEVWCRVRGSRRTIQPRTGTRPRDPIADLIFAFGYAVLQCEFHSLLREHGRLCSVAAPCGGDFSSSSVAGDECLVGDGCLVEVLPVNDTAVVITAACPGQLIPRLTLAAELVVRTCRKNGLSLNIWRWQRAGSCEVC